MKFFDGGPAQHGARFTYFGARTHFHQRRETKPINRGINGGILLLHVGHHIQPKDKQQACLKPDLLPEVYGVENAEQDGHTSNQKRAASETAISRDAPLFIHTRKKIRNANDKGDQTCAQCCNNCHPSTSPRLLQEIRIHTPANGKSGEQWSDKAEDDHEFDWKVHEAQLRYGPSQPRVKISMRTKGQD